MREINEILKYTKPLTLLYVDHNPEVRLRNQEIFIHYFRKVVCASDAAEALRLYKKQKEETQHCFDIVITDIEMPRINGIELCRMIFSENINQKLIALSAHNEPRYLFELINMGISSFLLKPITVQSLTEALYTTAKSIYDERLIRFRTQEVHSLNQKLKAKVAELNASLEKIDETTKEKDLFMANISHEIRTPMNGIIGLSELLLNTELDEKQTNYLVKIRHSAHLMLEIINDVLDYSKIEAGKMTIESVDFDLNNVLEHISDMVSLKAHDKGLDLAFSVAKDVPRRFIGDPLRIGQILLNLLSNAVKFTDQGSVHLTISVLKGDDTTRIVQFDVVDSGIGLSPEESAKLFQSFTQAAHSTTRQYGGTGLGLSISKQFSNLMGGDIVLESTAGRGSRFSLILPLSLSEPQERRLYRLPNASMMGKSVLIIDRQNHFADSLAQKLHYFRCSVDIFSSVADAPLQAREYDLVMVDIAQLEALSRMGTDRFADAKIVVMGNSSQLLSKYPHSSLTIGASLAKPCTQQMLFELLIKLYDEEYSRTLPFNRTGGKYSLFPLKGSKILLAEDNSINRQIVLGLLENTDIEVIIASNGLEVLKVLENQTVDLILMDIEMPIMNGYQAAKSIRSHSRHDGTPIIALTANVSSDDTHAISESGMQAHLKKPFNTNEFYAALVQFIPPKNWIDESYLTHMQ